MSSGANPASEADPAYERILAAATAVFGSYGFSKSTIQEISSAAHVSKPLFYRHFRNKEEVFARVVDHVLTQWRESLIEAVARTDGGMEAELRVLFLDSLEYGRAHKLIGRLITRDTQLLITTQSDVSDRAVAALQRLVEEILRRGVAAGEVRSDLEVAHMADLLTEIHFAYANRQLLTGIPVPDALAQDLVEGMLSAVRA
jgi:AcrR family transcriptional regulator